MIKILKLKIRNKTAKIGIIGLGYVGLPLAITFAKKFKVIGYDNSKKVIRSLLEGNSTITNLSSDQLSLFLNKTFFPTTDHTKLKDCDFLIICVPTPLTAEREPDLSYVKSACKIISQTIRKNQFVILESTTYPGTTEEIVIPILEKSGLTAGVDFGVAYSPERIDPGNKEFTIENTSKIVGGINGECTDIATSLYKSVINAKIVKVRDCKTAEATKIVENMFREVNIALINELALIFEKMGIDVWEVIDAAKTKPFGFMPFYPGPGVGGHCIPLDPHYLSYKAKKFGFIPRFIELSWEINEFMKTHVVNLVAEGLKDAGKTINDSKIAVLGVAYKKDIGDTRESPAKKIIEELINLGGSVKVYDPYAKSIETRFGNFISEKNIEGILMWADCAVFLTDHEEFKKISPTLLRERSIKVVVDAKNLLCGEDINKLRIIYKGIGKRG
jgi:UDP-N-acetyl-D-glucosamine dehydrogenase